MRKALIIASIAVAAVALTGCAVGSTGEYIPEPDPPQSTVPTLPPSNDLYADVQEVVVPLSDGRSVTCLRSSVRGGYTYECDWANVKAQ